MMDLYTIQARRDSGTLTIKREIKGAEIAQKLAQKIKAIAADDVEIVVIEEVFERIFCTPKIIK